MIIFLFIHISFFGFVSACPFFITDTDCESRLHHSILTVIYQ